MKLLIERDQLLTPLTTVTSVVERRQTLPILANVLVQLDSNTLTLTGTDLEGEFVCRFFADPLGHEPLSARAAQALLDKDPNVPLYHEVAVIRGTPKMD